MGKPDNPSDNVTAALIRDNYSTIWPPILHPWTDYLVACRKAFDGDLDAMLILAAIGTMTLQQFENGTEYGRRVTYDDMRATAYVGPAARAVNVELIAAYVGIPKETVRRKVGALVARGWVARGDKSSLSATSQSAADLEKLSGATFELLSVINTALRRTQAE